MRWARLTCAHTLASQTFLAKDDVAERIMMVVKNHEKVRAARWGELGEVALRG